MYSETSFLTGRKAALLREAAFVLAPALAPGALLRLLVPLAVLIVAQFFALVGISAVWREPVIGTIIALIGAASIYYVFPYLLLSVTRHQALPRNSLYSAVGWLGQRHAPTIAGAAIVAMIVHGLYFSYGGYASAFSFIDKNVSTVLDGHGALMLPILLLDAALLMLVQQEGRNAAYLSRACWIAASVAAAWALFDTRHMIEAGLLGDVGSQSRYTTAVILSYLYGCLALLVANAAYAAYVTVRHLAFEVRNGVKIDLDQEPTKVLRDIASAAPHLATTASKDVPELGDAAAVQPRLSFKDLSGMDELKAKLLEAANEWRNEGRMNGKNGVLLYGPPGTGKTAFAEALAGEIGLRIIKINIGTVASRWVNQTTEQLKQVFDAAVKQAPCVLFMDEVEAILPDRSTIARGDSEEAKVVGAFLSEVDKLRHARVLVVAATNYLDRMDAAAAREGRFDFRIEVGVPDRDARKGLILSTLKKSGKLVDAEVLDRLAHRWAGFNVPRIQEATRRAAGFAQDQTVTMRDFMRGLRDVQGNRLGVPESAPGLADLYFDEEVKERLRLLATTFAKSDEIEMRGGTVPKGVIFYGPPGTGKTTMAQAIAKEAGWAFVATSGKEIMANPDRLKQICRKASDLRPAIIFIDEADDILGDRTLSGVKTYTNDLLAAIDGATEPMPDVVWIIATNFVDALDEAVTRRFPTKIELPVPGLDTLTRMVRDWATKHATKLSSDPQTWSAEVANALLGLSPSHVKGILEAALNAEAANSVLRGEPMHITLHDVLKARREMRA